MASLMEHPKSILCLRTIGTRPFTPGTMVSHAYDSDSYGMVIATRKDDALVLWSTPPDNQMQMW
jgi:hypothetical protein